VPNDQVVARRSLRKGIGAARLRRARGRRWYRGRAQRARAGKPTRPVPASAQARRWPLAAGPRRRGGVGLDDQQVDHRPHAVHVRSDVRCAGRLLRTVHEAGELERTVLSLHLDLDRRRCAVVQQRRLHLGGDPCVPGELRGLDLDRHVAVAVGVVQLEHAVLPRAGDGGIGGGAPGTECRQSAQRKQAERPAPRAGGSMVLDSHGDASYLEFVQASAGAPVAASRRIPCQRVYPRQNSELSYATGAACMKSVAGPQHYPRVLVEPVELEAQSCRRAATHGQAGRIGCARPLTNNRIITLTRRSSRGRHHH